MLIANLPPSEGLCGFKKRKANELRACDFVPTHKQSAQLMEKCQELLFAEYLQSDVFNLRGRAQRPLLSWWLLTLTSPAVRVIACICRFKTLADKSRQVCFSRRAAKTKLSAVLNLDYKIHVKNALASETDTRILMNISLNYFILCMAWFLASLLAHNIKQ